MRLTSSSERLLRTVAAALPGGSVNVFDREHRYLFVAGNGLDGAALCPSTLMGRTLREVFGDQAALVEPFYERAFSGEQVSFDLPFCSRIYTITAAPLAEPFPAIVVLAQDVTTTRHELRQHELAEASLRSLNRERDVFLATMLHELRQPLAPMRFALEIIKQGDERRAARALTAMERQIQQLERLLSDLTEMAAGSADRLGLRLGTLDMTQLLKDVMHDAEGLMASKNHRLVRNLPAGPVAIYGDSGRLRQVFSNLLMNAAKYTPAGGEVTVTATTHQQDVRVSVKDNGQGIDAATLPRIFDLFVQEDAHGPGMGVGLSVVREIVRLHGGNVQAHSEGKGLGSDFIVTLPLTTR